MAETFTKDDMKRVQNTFEKIVAKYRVALADAIIRPQSVIPDSAKELISLLDIEMAVKRQEMFSREIEKPSADACFECSYIGSEVYKKCRKCREKEEQKQTEEDKKKHLSCGICNRFLSSAGECVGWNCPANPEVKKVEVTETTYKVPSL